MRRHLAYILLSLTAVGCTGNLPPSGTLPNMDGSALTGVKASVVGNTSATTIESAITTVGSATSDSGASTLVKRDASGAFSGTLNGSATYALGSQGADIIAAATLPLGGDGNVFNVVDNSSSTTISALSEKPKGSRVTLRFVSGGTILQHGNAFALAGAGTFKTVANDVFEFVSLGGGAWRELTRTVSKESHSLVQLLASNLTATTGGAAVIYDDIIEDHQGEYSTADGYIRIHQSGTYQITAQVTLAPGAGGWPAGSYCHAFIVFSLQLSYTIPGAPSLVTSSMSCLSSVSITMDLPVGTMFRIRIAHNDTTTPHAIYPSQGSGFYTWLSVTRK